MTRPLLAFCVPTYNRPEQLRACLAHLTEHARPHGLPIHVSDNASDYDFDALLAEAQAAYPLITARRNPTNLGMGANFLKVVELADAEFVWLFSDDDRLVPGALDAVLPLCRAGRHDLIIPNREYRKDDLSFDYGMRASQLETDLEILDPDALLVEACVRHFTYIGCLVFRLDRWRRVDGARYAPFPYFPHLSIVAEMMKPDGRALLMAKVLIHVRGAGFSWERRAAAVWYRHLQAAVEMVPGYPPAVKRRALRRVWSELSVYPLWLVTRHGVRRESLRAVATADTVRTYARLGAWDQLALNVGALAATLVIPAPVFGAARQAVRAARRLRAGRPR